MSAVLLLASAAGFAETARMYYRLKGDGSGWIPVQLFLEYDTDRKSARVVDGIILHFNDTPISTDLSQNSAKKITFSWDIMTRARQQSARMNYRVAFFKGNGKAQMTNRPRGFANNFTARD